jgi:ATP-dependent Lhr-like helicase
VVNSLGWQSLRPFQEEAIGPILGGNHFLLVAPTAGGKTEAAILPLLSRMLTEDWRGLSVLYVCPLRALLNNLFPRIEHYAGLVGRRAGIWHGDVGTSARRAIISNPPDILLTTPESLEVMLITRREHHAALFGRLRAVVVDEIHAFAGDDRGWHLVSVLERLNPLSGHPAQRIGLSATVGNASTLLKWLVGERSETEGTVVNAGGPPGAAELTIDAVGNVKGAATVIEQLHAGEKRLVFCDSRSKVEDLASQLRERGVQTFVSHSSLSLDERRRAEEAFASGSDCVIVSTSTLELGIDVGDLDRVIQLDAPVAVASFLQRLGRTGRRRGTTRNHLFLSTADESLMQAAALVQLWGAGFVEQVLPPPAPLHIFAQQFMALALQHGGIAAQDWRKEIGGVRPFHNMSDDDAAGVVSYMVDIGIMHQDQGHLWLGPRGESEYGRRHFMELFTTFITDPLIGVRHGARPIGTVAPTTFARWPQAEVTITLGGERWDVTHVDWRERLAYVVPSKNEGRSQWSGSGQPIRYELCQAMRDVLLGCDLPARLSKRAQEALASLRSEFHWLDAASTAVVRADGQVQWWTFGGLFANAAIASALKADGYTVAPNNLSIRFKGAVSSAGLERSIATVRAAEPELLVPEVSAKAVEGLKFNVCLPDGLAHRVLQSRMMDVPAVQKVLAEPVRFTTVQERRPEQSGY